MEGLPAQLIFLDLNGTLIPEESRDGVIPADAVRALQGAIFAARAAGYAIGLCSDSPLPELLSYGASIGLDDMAIAENGNIFYRQGDKTIVRTLDSLSAHVAVVRGIAEQAGFSESGEIVAPEFSGSQPAYENREWGLGAHRETSLSVFGPEVLINLIGEHYRASDNAHLSIDCSPSYNYFAVHPGDYRQNKGDTLTQLQTSGSEVLMIGNSGSDWVSPASGVKCTFVGEARITEEMRSGAFMLTNKLAAYGVADILHRISVA